MRFANRKYCKQILYNWKKFKKFHGSGIGTPNTKIFVNENLTNFVHQLAFNCCKLKGEKLILKTYPSNGIIHIVQIHRKKTIKVFHQSKLDELFSDFNFVGGGEVPKVAHECAWVIFYLPLKIVKEYFAFYACVYFLHLLFFLMINVSVDQITVGWLRRNITWVPHNFNL